MFISDSNFYYSLALNSIITGTALAIVDFLALYPAVKKVVKKEDVKKGLRNLFIGNYGLFVALGYLGLLVYKYVFHQIAPLYLSLAVASSVMALTAILGFMYAGTRPEFFNNPHKLETKRVTIGMIISVTGIVLAVILFL